MKYKKITSSILTISAIFSFYVMNNTTVLQYTKVVALDSDDEEEDAVEKEIKMPNKIRRNIRFSKDEDDIITNYVKANGTQDWETCAKLLPGRNRISVKARYLIINKEINIKIPKKAQKRMAFSKDEDDIITNYVKANGTQDWETCAKLLPGRDRRSVRARYFAIASCTNTKKFTDKEKSKLIKAVEVHGRTWSQIKELYFKDSVYSDVQLKNKYDSIIKEGALSSNAQTDLSVFEDYFYNPNTDNTCARIINYTRKPIVRVEENQTVTSLPKIEEGEEIVEEIVLVKPLFIN